MTTRTAVLYGERDEVLGRCGVPESTMVIQHQGAMFVRSEKAQRLPGGSVGVIFCYVEPIVRDRLDQAPATLVAKRTA